MNKKLHFILGLGITIACLYWLLEKLDWELLYTYIQDINKYLIASGALCICYSHIVLSRRLKWLLIADNIPFSKLFRVYMISMLGNVILPFRSGDISKIFFIKNYTKRSILYAASTVLIERLSDILILIFFGTLTFAFVELPYNSIPSVPKEAFFVVTLLIIFAIPLIKKINKLEKYLKTFKDIYSINIVIKVFVIAFLGWCLSIIAFKLFLYAFNIELLWLQTIFFVAFTYLCSCIPSAPGGIGVYHVSVILCLSFWEIEYNLALAFAIASHAILFLIQILMGLTACLKEGGISILWKPREFIEKSKRSIL